MPKLKDCINLLKISSVFKFLSDFENKKPDNEIVGGSIIELVKGQTAKENKEFWAIVSIPPQNVFDYLIASESGQAVNLNKFGSIIKTGWGDLDEPHIKALENQGLFLDLRERVERYCEKVELLLRSKNGSR